MIKTLSIRTGHRLSLAPCSDVYVPPPSRSWKLMMIRKIGTALKEHHTKDIRGVANGVGATEAATPVTDN